MEKMETISSTIRNKKMETISSTIRNYTLIQYSTGIPSQNSKTAERNKGDLNREERSQIIPIYR
jgi:hypothetical protein